MPRTPQDPRPPGEIPERERFYFLEERYPKYGNLLPRDIATREIFNVCIHEGLSADPKRMCVYLDVTQLPRDLLDRKLAGILEIYEKFQGADPRTTAMKIFPAVHYSMGGLWCDYEADAKGGLVIGSPRNQQTNVPGVFAIGECDYQFHGANRLGANSLVACLFSGLTAAPGIVNYAGDLANGAAAEQPSSLFDRAVYQHEARYQAMLTRGEKRDRFALPERPEGCFAQSEPVPLFSGVYSVHAELGRVMTKAATVIRHNAELTIAYATVCELEEQARGCSLADTGDWANQEVVFARALEDMFPLAKTIVKGRLPVMNAAARTTSRSSPCRRSRPRSRPSSARQAQQWCGRFEENNRKWLKTTIATLSPTGEPQLSYEDVDTSLVRPRPRLYGVVGGEVIEQVWKEREAAGTQ